MSFSALRTVAMIGVATGALLGRSGTASGMKLRRATRLTKSQENRRNWLEAHGVPFDRSAYLQATKQENQQRNAFLSKRSRFQKQMKEKHARLSQRFKALEKHHRDAYDNEHRPKDFDDANFFEYAYKTSALLTLLRAKDDATMTALNEITALLEGAEPGGVGETWVGAQRWGVMSFQPLNTPRRTVMSVKDGHYSPYLMTLIDKAPGSGVIDVVANEKQFAFGFRTTRRKFKSMPLSGTIWLKSETPRKDLIAPTAKSE